MEEKEYAACKLMNTLTGTEQSRVIAAYNKNKSIMKEF